MYVIKERVILFYNIWLYNIKYMSFKFKRESFIIWAIKGNVLDDSQEVYTDWIQYISSKRMFMKLFRIYGMFEQGFSAALFNYFCCKK